MASYHRVPLSLSLVVLLCITASSCLKYTLLEEQAEATVVADIKTDSGLVAKYPDDIVNQLWFSFRQEGGIYDLFEIHPASGVIKTRQVIDRESLVSCHHTRHCELELAISVKPLKYFEIIKITVEVVDINDNVPTFPERRISWSITETTRPGTRFVVPSAEDNDSGIYGIQKYNLTALTTSKFRLQLTNHTDGSIEVALVLVDTLDREHEQFYPIKITAWDGGEPEQSGSVLIDILIADANDNNPAFTNATYEVTVYENVQRDTVVAQVHAFDPDSGQNGEVSYSLAPNTQQELGDLFGIDNATGEIWVRGEVDYEQENSYELQVMASDLGPHSLPAFAKVNIRVLDVNDHGPEISFNTFVSSGHAEVAENADIGVFVAHVSVSDPDQGASGQFDCGLSSPLFTFEELGAADGSAEYMVVTATTFDREKQDQYRVTLTCTDRGDVPMSSSTRIVVDIMDANDHSPHFAQDVYMARLYENNDLNALITRLSASDSDSGGNGAIRYSIECLDPEEAVQDVVTIDAISGDIRAATVFDHETRQHYELVVVATDHAGLNSKSASTMLSLSIDDVNDEFPQFDQLVYAMEIKENLPANAHVGTVTATDKDGPLYNKIIYTIDNYLSHTDAFDINSRTGEIIATRGLDREQQANYTVIVFATNVGYPDVSTHVNVTISVIDDNDHDPQVLFPSPRNNTLQISTDSDIGHVITRVSATDADRGDNQVLHYAITNGNDEDLFAIDSQTGAITVAQHLQDYDQKAMKLVIVVEDSGQSPRNTIVDLNLLLAKPASAQSSLLQGSNFVILVGVVSGAVLIIVIIIISILCTRCRSRHNSKTYHYNCQVEANKRLSNGSLTDSDSKDRHLDLSSAVDCDIVKDKDFTQVKKEVTFNVDQEDLYSLQPSWPLYAHEAGLLHQQPVSIWIIVCHLTAYGRKVLHMICSESNNGAVFEHQSLSSVF